MVPIQLWKDCTPSWLILARLFQAHKVKTLQYQQQFLAKNNSRIPLLKCQHHRIQTLPIRNGISYIIMKFCSDYFKYCRLPDTATEDPIMTGWYNEPFRSSPLTTVLASWSVASEGGDSDKTHSILSQSFATSSSRLKNSQHRCNTVL